MDREDMATLLKVAEKVYASGVCPPDHKNADQTFAVMLAGAELGLGPMQSIRNIQIVKGKLSLTSDFTVALCARHAVCKYFRCTETTATRAVYETHRGGHAAPTSLVYTLEMATRAGLTGSPTWKNHPEAMLRARCAAALARSVYPDLVAGVYAPDEADEIAREGKPADGEAPEADEKPETEKTPDEPPAENTPMARLRLGLTAVETIGGMVDLWAELGKALNDAGVASEARKVVADDLAAKGYALTAAELTAVLAGTMAAPLRQVHDELALLDAEDPVRYAAAILRTHRAALHEYDRPVATRAAVRRLEALKVADAKAALTAELTPPDGPKGGASPPSSPTSTVANGSSAQSSAGAGATAMVSDEVQAMVRHWRAKPMRGADQGAAAVAGSWWAHMVEVEALPRADQARAKALVLAELRRRGVEDPDAWLTKIGTKNGLVKEAA